MEKAYVVPDNWFLERYKAWVQLQSGLRPVRHLLSELQHGFTGNNDELEESVIGLISLLDLWEDRASEEAERLSTRGFELA